MSGKNGIMTLEERELDNKRIQMRVFPYLQNNTPMHGHTFAEIAVITEGHGTHRTIREMSELVPGDVLLVPYGAVHAYENVDNLRLVNVLFQPSRLPMIPELLQLPRCSAFMAVGGSGMAEVTIRKLHLEPFLLEQVREVLDKMIREYRKGDSGIPCCMLGYFIVLLSMVLSAPDAGNATQPQIPENIARAVSYMRNHYAEQLCLRDLVKVSRMSMSSFMRGFAEHVGTAPMNYLAETRLHKACALLQETDLSISEIAIATGFNDSNYFSRLFRKHLDTTPRHFRLVCCNMKKSGQPFSYLFSAPETRSQKLRGISGLDLKWT